MDYDADGILDLVSGSYDPGEVYLFRGQGKGKFKARETLVDKNGKPIISKPDQKQHWESFGSWLALVDWDDDGDLDIVLGTFEGHMLLRVNEGTRAKPAFATGNVPVEADGKPLKAPGHHATPVVADWNGDGLWDLLTGSDNGGVYWYRNVGARGRPRFAAAATLVAPHVGNGYNEFLDRDAEPTPGIRSQIAVADFDADGKLDLLVGDFVSTESPRPELKPDERDRLCGLREKLVPLQARMAKEREKLEAELDAFYRGFPEAERTSNAVQEKWRKKRKELYDRPAMKQMSGEYGELRKELKPLFVLPAEQRFGADDYSTPHGYVWLFRRK